MGTTERAMPEAFYTASLSRTQGRSTWAPEDDGKQHLYDSIAEDLSRKLIDLGSCRVRTERLSKWRSAFDESGPRWTFRRVKLIAGQIYDRTAPIPDVTPSPDHNALLQEVAEPTREAVESVGAELL